MSDGSRFSGASALVLALCLAGCSHGSTADAQSPETETQARVIETPALVAKTGERIAVASPRRIGDRYVHRYSGEYRGEALIVVEEVIAQEGPLLVVDYQTMEGHAPLHLRVRMAVRSERIVSVHEMVEGTEIPSTQQVFDQLMAETSFVPQSNHGLTASQTETCLVGKDEFDCRVAQFAVQVDGQEATLSVARSESMRRDLSGEIIAVDGTVLYKADLIEMERGEAVPDADEATAALQTPTWARRD